MKFYIKSSSHSKHLWSKPFKTSEYSYDNTSMKVSTCNFDDGYLGVVFYGEASYILFDPQGREVDGNACSTVREAKYECENAYETIH